MDEELLDKLQEIKVNLEMNSSGEKILDIVYYGKINLSKNDTEIKNMTTEEVHLVKKEKNGHMQYEFHAKDGVIATVGENNEITISEKYKEKINEKEFFIQLAKEKPISLEKLKQIDEHAKNEQLKEKQQNTNNKEVEIDINKKITKDMTFADLVPEVKTKNIQQVKIRRIDSTKFEFYGIDSNNNEIELQTLQETQGTNPQNEIVEINKDGSEVHKNAVLTMVKIQKGNNQGYENEGFTVDIGAYGNIEINYYRRDPGQNQFTSIPVSTTNTDQKHTEQKVREYATKPKNPEVGDNIKKANDQIEQNPQEKTVLENIDDDPNNDKQQQEQILIEKAAKRCKMSVESFKQEYEKAEGKTVYEKIENAEDEINEQFRNINLGR